MNGKAAIASTGIWGGLIAVIGPLVGPVAQAVIPTLSPQWQVIISGLVSAGGGLLAIYGRASATTQITGVLAPK